MGVVDHPIQEGIGRRRVFHLPVPLLHRQLADQDRTGLPISVFRYFQQVIALPRGDNFKSEVFQDKKLYFFKLFQLIKPAAVQSPLLKLIQQPNHTPVLDASLLAARLLAQRTTYLAFAAASWPCSQDILAVGNVMPVQKLAHLFGL